MARASIHSLDTTRRIVACAHLINDARQRGDALAAATPEARGIAKGLSPVIWEVARRLAGQIERDPDAGARFIEKHDKRRHGLPRVLVEKGQRLGVGRTLLPHPNDAVARASLEVTDMQSGARRPADSGRKPGLGYYDGNAEEAVGDVYNGKVGR